MAVNKQHAKEFLKSQLLSNLCSLCVSEAQFDVPSVALPPSNTTALGTVHACCCLQDDSCSSGKHILLLLKMKKSDTSMLAT